jgi:hypothetical protein
LNEDWIVPINQSDRYNNNPITTRLLPTSKPFTCAAQLKNIHVPIKHHERKEKIIPASILNLHAPMPYAKDAAHLHAAVLYRQDPSLALCWYENTTVSAGMIISAIAAAQTN